MKKLAYNTGLVFALTAFFALPLLGFGFITYEEDSDPTVLGTTTTYNNVKRNADLTIREQFEYEVVLAENADEQTLYDVVPFSYVNNQNKFVVFIPKEFKDQGILAELVKKNSSLDLVFTSENSLNTSLEFPATILVLN